MKTVTLTPNQGAPRMMSASEFAEYWCLVFEGTSHAKNFTANAIKSGATSQDDIAEIFDADGIRGIIEYRLCRGFASNNRALWRFLNWVKDSGGFTATVSEQSQ